MLEKDWRRVIAVVLFICSIAGNLCAVVLDLPDKTPGLQVTNPKRTVNDENETPCKHVIVPGTQAEEMLNTNDGGFGAAIDCEENLYFPANGVQPTTKEAAQYSCANCISDEVTDWYIRAFGGDSAVKYSKLKDEDITPDQPQDADEAPKFGFEKLEAPIDKEKTTIGTNDNADLITLKAQTAEKHIITVDGNDGFKKSFWKTFRVIASDPVGRVLLYRLIIEIRRKYRNDVEETLISRKYIIKGNTGSVENHIIQNNFLEPLERRNNCRSITIKSADSCAFSSLKQHIKFNNSNTETTSVVKTDEEGIETEYAACPADIGLFHEMLHWFHYLRDYIRYSNDCEFDGSYCHLMMCYYGNNELQTLFNKYNELFAWASIEYKEEEMRTILGTPNYNNKEELNMFPPNVFIMDTGGESKYIPINSANKKHINSSGKFLNGDDSSENAYRMSRSKSWKDVKMRFGHAGLMKPVRIINKKPFEVDGCLLHKDRFNLPKLVAKHCYKNITGKEL
jgi:hypothetical protein